jgi:phage terminase large subunit
MDKKLKVRKMPKSRNSHQDVANKEEIVNIGALIPNVYTQLVVDALEEKYTEYVLKGGRGSLKSSIASLLAVLNVIDGKGSSVCIRRYKTTLRGSCYNDIQAVIDRLGVVDEFTATSSPLQFKHKNGYSIEFRGLDDPQKIKSLKSNKGQFTFLWFEETQEIEGFKKCRSVIQTVARGGKHCNVIFTFNPPPTKTHWVNKDLSNIEGKARRIVLHTTYLQVPKEWLGEQFLEIAEDLKANNFDAYRNEYLGEAVGAEGMIFPNVRPLTKDIKYNQNRVYRGNDFGYANDPNAYVAWYYDKALHSIFLKFSSYKKHLDLDILADIIKSENKHNFTVYCDSAEPRSIDTLNKLGVTGATACSKGADSVRHGIKWLQGLRAIYIDPVADKEVYKEFSEYEYARDKNGDYISEYPDKDNHSIDASRYALQDVIRGYI